MSPPPAPSLLFGRTLFAAVAVLAAGCGLADYEARMAAEKAKLARLDREVRYLGEPLKMPPPRKEGDKEVTWLVFLRGPKVISETPQPQLMANLLAVYPATTQGNFQALYLGVNANPKDVLALFPAHSEVRNEKVQIETSGRPLTFTRYSYDDRTSSLSVNFLDGSTTAVVIIYRAEKGRLTGDNAEAVQTSLGTLGVDGDLGRVREEYDRRKFRHRS